MNNIVTTRKLDKLGRIVIPKEFCDELNIGVKTPLNIIIEGDSIILEEHIKEESRHKKPIGIIRKLDDLGRIVIPKELRDEMDIGAEGALAVRTEGNRIFVEAVS